MAFPSLTTSPPVNHIINNAQQEATSYKSFAESSVEALAAGTVSSSLVLNLNSAALALVTCLDVLIATGNADTYAETQLGIPGLVSEAQALKDKVVKVFQAVQACVPMDDEGFLKNQKINADGTITTIPLGSSETTQLQTALSDVIAAIS